MSNEQFKFREDRELDAVRIDIKDCQELRCADQLKTKQKNHKKEKGKAHTCTSYCDRQKEKEHKKLHQWYNKNKEA